MKQCPYCKTELKKEYPETCSACGWISNELKKKFTVLTMKAETGS